MKIADDAESISRRLKELEAERNEAMTGSSAPVTGQEQNEELPMGYGDYLVWSPSAFNDAVREHMASKQYQAAANSINYMAGLGNGNLGSLAHPGWPYAGTGFEWRKFVRS